MTKIIHMMWFQGFQAIPAYLAGTPKSWETLNPGYQILKWDFESTGKFIRDNYPSHYSAWNNLDLVIKKCDLGRLLILHFFGGVYVDCDLIPQTPLDVFLSNRQRYCSKTSMVRKLPVPAPAEPVDFDSYEVILSREHRQIDIAGFGIANGVILAKPGSDFILEFVNSRYRNVTARVLDYVGPHALTRFVRGRHLNLTGRIAIVCPYYFLWEDSTMDEPPPSWCVSKHLAINHWGNKARQDWWNI